MWKLLKALNFMKKIHEYKMKCFFKNTYFEPNFPKIKIFNQDPYIFNHQTCFAKNSWNFQTWLAKPKLHTIARTKFSKEKLV